MDLPDYLNSSIGEVIFKGFQKLALDEVFQINAETGSSQTGREVFTRSVQVASGLRNLGVEVEDIVAVLSHYSENSIATLFGSLLQGAAPFPMEHNLKQREMEHMFRVALPKVVFVNQDRLPEAINALKAIGHQAPIYVLDGQGTGARPFDDILDKSADIATFEYTKIDRPDERIAAVIPSSGTTGLPKGVAATHRAHLYQFYLWNELTPRTPYLQLTPPFWISGFGLLIFSPVFGYARIYTVKNTAESIIRATDKYKPGWAGLAPITMARILNYPDLDKFDMTSITRIIIGGSAVPHSTINLCKEKLPHITLCQAYGATEISGIITVPFDSTDVYSAGRPFPQHNCKIVDNVTRNPVGPYEDGEIVFKSPSTMKYYLRNPQATIDAFDKNGYYRTGDVGHFNDKGYIFITGRSKELMKVKNHQVSPVEVEDVIRGLPGVADVAVVGIPHEIDQNHPRALVVKEPGSSLTVEQIVQEVADKLSDTKHLFAGAQFVDTIPRNANGKLLRLELPKLVVL